jgi:SAM-dependent methyltransferase
MSHSRTGLDVRAHPGGWDELVRHYDACLERYGPTPRGADWPNGADLAVRFQVMSGILDAAGDQPLLLDLGCGAGLLIDYLAATRRLDAVRYRGIDLSRAMVEAARQRWPDRDFECRDIVAAPLPEQSVDIVIMNGVLTERVGLSVQEMTALAQALVTAAFRSARVGIAFNVMNAHVVWQREDLFHWPFDAVAAFVRRELTAHYGFRADYGLYEYTCFAWRQPRRAAGPIGNWWTR